MTETINLGKLLSATHSAIREDECAVALGGKRETKLGMIVIPKAIACLKETKIKSEVSTNPARNDLNGLAWSAKAIVNKQLGESRKAKAKIVLLLIP